MSIAPNGTLLPVALLTIAGVSLAQCKPPSASQATNPRNQSPTQPANAPSSTTPQLPTTAAEVAAYRNRAISVEARTNLAEIGRRIQQYFYSERLVPGTTQILTGQLPPSQSQTPAALPAGQRVTDPPGTWDTPGWKAIEFSITSPHYYSYELITNASGFTARAIGDIDGDGQRSVFELVGRVENQDLTLAPISVQNELE